MNHPSIDRRPIRRNAKAASPLRPRHPRPTLMAAALHLALLAGAACAAGALALPHAALAQAANAETKTFNVPAGPLDAALDRFARAAGVNLSYEPALISGLSTRGLSGSHRVGEGLSLLLAGSGLEAVAQGGGFTLRKLAVVPEVRGDAQTLPLVRVTAKTDAAPGELPKPYAGGQVARGGRVGLLGDKDFLDTPFNMTTYTAQMIEDQQARSIAEIVANNPSFRVIYTDSDVANDFMVRGNKVKSLDMAYNGLYGLTSPCVEAVERVEVLSGANAMLNGLGPIGGVGGSINLVAKRALDAPLTRLSAGYVSNAQFGLRTDISRRFGSDGQFGLRVNAGYTEGDTAIDRQGKRVGFVALALDFRGDGVRINADLGYRRNDVRSPSRTTFVGTGFAIPNPPPNKASWQQGWSYDNTESWMGALRGEVDLAPNLTAYAAAGASRFTEAEFFANSQLTSSSGALAQRTVYWPLYRDSSTAEAGLRGKFDTGPVKHSVSLAASGLWVKNGILINNLTLINTNIYNPVFISAPSIAGLAGPNSVPKTGMTDLSGVAVSDTLGMFDDRVQITLGLRRQNVKVESYSATTGATTASYEKSATTPGVGAIFKVASNVSLYGNYIEGLQQGPTAPAGSTNVGQIFAPYVSKQGEGGVKFDFGSFATTVGVYQLKTPNGVTDPVSKVYSISGEQRTRGVEINTFGEIMRGWRLLGGVAFVDARQTKTAGGTNDGRQVTGAPKVQLNLGTEWDVAALPGLTLSARAIHTAAQYVDVGNLQSVPAWTTLDLGARYRTRVNNLPATIRLNVQNAFDKSYWASAIDGYLVQSLPRTFLLSGTVDF